METRAKKKIEKMWVMGLVGPWRVVDLDCWFGGKFHKGRSDGQTSIPRIPFRVDLPHVHTYLPLLLAKSTVV
jgi:hypothetical protein